MERLDLSIQTLFADFQESVLQRFRLEQARAAQEIFVRKRVKNKDYWYAQTSAGSQKNKQRYIGPVDAANNRRSQENREEVKKQTDLIQQLILRERKKCALLKRAGFPEVDRKTAKLLDHFSKLNISFRNGVLVGSLAFFAYPGILGTVFDHGSLKTDIDLARRENEAVSVTTTEELFQGFARDIRAVPGLKHLSLPSSFIYQNEIKLDFLIPKLGKERTTYKFPGVVGLGAEALRFLDYLIAERVDGVLLSKNKAILVTVPHPVRYALHKILVAMNRGVHEHAKRTKDLHQASQLIVVCTEEMPDFLESSLKELFAKGKKWKTLFKKGATYLSPEAQILLK